MVPFKMARNFKRHFIFALNSMRKEGWRIKGLICSEMHGATIKDRMDGWEIHIYIWRW